MHPTGTVASPARLPDHATKLSACEKTSVVKIRKRRMLWTGTVFVRLPGRDPMGSAVSFSLSKWAFTGR